MADIRQKLEILPKHVNSSANFRQSFFVLGLERLLNICDLLVPDSSYKSSWGTHSNSQAQGKSVQKQTDIV